MAEIKSIRKIYADGRHNAFTHIEYWKGHYYVSFRNAGAHGRPGKYGKIFIIRSSDLSTWKLCKEISTEGDVREANLVNMGDEFGVFFASNFPKEPGQLLYEKGSLRKKEVHSYATFTSDGTTWSSPQLYECNSWLWKVEKLNNSLYGTVRNFKDYWSKSGRMLKLIKSVDGRHWKTIFTFPQDKIHGGETGIWITKDERMHLVIRAFEGIGTAKGFEMGILAQSRPPYRKWKIKELNYAVQSPVIRSVKNELWVAGRGFKKQFASSILPPEPSPEKIKALASRDKYLANWPEGCLEQCMAIWRLVGGNLEPMLILPSRGDCGYPGLLVEEDRVLVTYYSQHDIDKGPTPRPGETPDEIYLAEILPG